jgi:hypothetical protein
MINLKPIKKNLKIYPTFESYHTLISTYYLKQHFI